jgi:hypothetical protein
MTAHKLVEGEVRSSSLKDFRNLVAVTISVLALLLAIATLAGGNVSGSIVNNNIRLTDTWAFYQAKNIRQTSWQIAVQELELTLPALPADQQQIVLKKIEDGKAMIEDLDNHPDPSDPTNPFKGEGKVQLVAQGRDLESKIAHAQAQAPSFNYASALYQIAIVLGSISIVAMSRLVFSFTLSLGVIATVLMLNGFFLLFRLPFL